MKIYHLIFILHILSAVQVPVDFLPYIQTGVASLQPPMLTVGTNTLTVGFIAIFSSIPSCGASLIEFSSQNNSKYGVIISVGSILQTGASINLNLPRSIWSSLSFNIFASNADSLILGNTIIYNLGSSTNTNSIVKNVTLASSIVTSSMDKVKFDVFIFGFDLDTNISGINNSQFHLNVSINYLNIDQSNSLYSTYGDYIYQLDGSGNLPGNNNVGGAVTSTQISLLISWLGTLSVLQISYIGHPITTSSTAIVKLSTGYNTFSVNSYSYNYNSNLFDANNNKNSLGSLSPMSIYGFNTISLIAVNSIDATILLSYSYFTNITSIGSKINHLSSSYYFYQPLADIIVSKQLDSFVIALDTWTGMTSIPATQILNLYFPVTFADNNPKTITSQIINVVSGYDYMFTLQVLDQQGCWNDINFQPSSIQISALNSITTLIKLQSSSNNFFVNPNVICTSSTNTQFSTPIESMFRYYNYKFTVNATTTQITLTIQSNNNILFLKNLNIYLISGNQIINPSIYQATVSSYSSFYTISPITNFRFYPLINSVSVLVGIAKIAPLSIITNSFNLIPGNTYTLSFQILDSAGNLSNYFTTPTVSIAINSNQIFSKTASLSQPFCSSKFASTTILSAPVDSYYLQIITTFVANISSNVLTFTFTDLSLSPHIYGIKGIRLYYTNFLDPNSGVSTNSCPVNTYLFTNTFPFTCLNCSAQGKTISNSKCECPINTALNPLTNFCVNCYYSCQTCIAGVQSSCLTCLSNRTMNSSSLCNCSPGFVQISYICVKCNYACITCVTNSQTCTSCPSSRNLDPKTSKCTCQSDYQEDGTNVQCRKMSIANILSSPKFIGIIIGSVIGGILLIGSISGIIYWQIRKNKFAKIEIEPINVSKIPVLDSTTSAKSKSKRIQFIYPQTIQQPQFSKRELL